MRLDPTILTAHYIQYLIFITATENPALQRYDVIKRNVVRANVETVDYLELVISMMSRGCQVSLKAFEISRGSLLSLLWCSVASWCTVWEP